MQNGSQQINSQLRMIRNKSAFLIEQLNLDGQPTQQEVLQRAQELQITDLQLARKSLTMLMPSQWKPYCNRYQHIYYINLIEQKAYLDHPIDMIFKKQFARKNNLPVPIFQQFNIDEIATSIDLINREIDKIIPKNNQLNIVYEQSDQHQQESYLPQNIQLTQLQIGQLQRFQQQLRQQNKKWIQQYRNQKQQKIIKYQKELINKRKQQQKIYIDKQLLKIQQQINLKNQNSLIVNLSKYQQQLNQKKYQMQKILHQQIQLRISISTNYQQILNTLQKNKIINRIYMIKQAQQKINMQYQIKLMRIVEKFKQQFNINIIEINGCQHYQKSFKKLIDQLEKPKSRNKIFQNHKITYKDINKEESLQVQQCKNKLHQIEKQVVWATNYSYQKKFYYPKKSLTLRLWKKIL